MVTETMRKNNKWRRRIIRLLDDIVMDLRSRPPSLEQAAVIDKLAALSDRADSMFEGLKGIEITESLYYTRSIEISNKGDHIRYKLKDCAEDMAFAVYCFLQDATYFRLFSARAWREFALGTIGIQTATFCTNNADALIATMSEQLRKMFDHFSDSWMTRMHTKVDRFFRQHCGNGAVLTDIGPDAISPDCEHDTLARYAKRRLGYFGCTLTCVRITRMVFEAFRGSQNQFWGNTQDDMRLLKSLYQLRCLEWVKDVVAPILRIDCSYLAAAALVKDHVDTDAVFAAQMLYDIQQQINPQAVGLEHILEQMSQDYLRLYQRYIPEWNTEKLQASHPSRVGHMYRQYMLLNHNVSTACNIQDTMERWEHTTGRQYTLPGFQLLRHVPLLIGQLVAQYRDQFQDTFLDIANDHGHILTAIHLYNAARNSGALQTIRWEDMEWVIDRQSYYTIFAGEPPATNTEYASRFCLVYGLDSTKFAIDRKPAIVGRVKNDVHLKDSPPRRLESCAQHVRISSRRPEICPHKPWPDQRRVMMKEFADTQLDWFSPYGKPNSIGVLIAARESYESDEEALNFDIFDFHLRCSRLLKTIRDLCLKEAPDDYSAIRFGGKEGINPTIAELLCDLTDCPRHHDKMWPKAIKLLSGMIQEEGSACYDMAWARLEMTTLDSISMDIDESGSDSDTVLGTPSPDLAGSDPGTNNRKPDVLKSGILESDEQSYTSEEKPEACSIVLQTPQQRMR